MDTLDYSGTGINTGSKVVFAAYGDPIRQLDNSIPPVLETLSDVKCQWIMPGVVAIQTGKYTNAAAAQATLDLLNEKLSSQLEQMHGTPLLVWCDDAEFTAATLKNFLWVTFTRSNPSHDIYGIAPFHENKHWGCRGPVVIDARIKPHHAPAVELDPEMIRKTDRLFAKGGSLEGVLL
jgi:4-hydroxy-3-polyprenylbenzoate decarboxylase